MPVTDKNGKLTYQMVSPGEAWMNFTNSKEGHNAAPVTPVYLSQTTNKESALSEKIEERKQQLEREKAEGIEKQLQQKAANKSIEHDKG